MKDNLKDIFSNVNEWLKFAETKNAGLIVLDGALIFGATSVLTQNYVPIPQYVCYYLYSFILFNGLGLVIALFSFWPQTQIDDDVRGDNTLFYGHIKDYTPESYLAKLRESSNKDSGEHSGLELDYANQVIINSRITYRKYSYFKAALFCTISALLTPIVSILLVIILRIIND